MQIAVGLLFGASMAMHPPHELPGCFGFHEYGEGGQHTQVLGEPPRDFRWVDLRRAKSEEGVPINFGMSGSWFEPQTSGQGMLIEVLPGRQLLNVAWFTHAAVEADDDPQLQRWLFGTGAYSGNEVEMTLTLSRGGRFDAPPVLLAEAVGTLRLRFVDCAHAVADYAVFAAAIRGLPDPASGPLLEGSIALQRIGESSVCEQFAVAETVGRVAIRNVTLLPMDSDRSVPAQTVLVEQGRITAIGAVDEIAVPLGTRLVEGAGRWLMPGLIDGHTHEIPLSYWPRDTAGNLLMYLANGVTSIVNMGDFTGLPIQIAAQVAAGELPGPTIYVGHFARGAGDGGTPQVLVRNPAEAAQLVQRASNGGYHFIKSYSRIDRASFDALVADGARQGLPLLGHVSADFPYLQAAQGGQRMFVHSSDVWAFGFGGSFNAGAIPGQAALLRDRGVALGSTLAVIELIKDFGLDAQAGNDLFARVLAQEGIEYMDDRAISAWRRMLSERPDIQQPRDLRQMLAFLQQLIGGFHQAGVAILPGSDTIGIPGVVPGFSLQRELELLRDSGLGSFAALQAATRTQGQYIEAQFRGETDRLGVIEVGARADLLLLDADPRLQLRTLRQPAGVMARGRWYSGEWLEAQLQRLRLER